MQWVTALLLILLCSTSMWAQQTITGVVTDTGKLPLPGVTVAVKGTTNRGTVTNMDGHYSIKAGPQETLVFSYVGMITREIPVGNRSTIDVTLQDDVSALEEVVVVGYGTQKKVSVTGAISSVKGDEILKAPAMNLSNMIGARVAGVSAIQSSGQPGSDGASLRMRGQGNIVFIIDGIRRTAEDFNGLDPNEIESVSILKDASAVAVYGLDANGAFIVTTKKGRTDDLAISYTGTYGISQNAVQQQWLDGPGYAYWYNKARELDGNKPIFTDEMVQNMRAGTNGWGNTNWYAKLYGTGHRQHHNLSATGGSKKVRFFASLGYLNEVGNIEQYTFDRFNLRSNVDADITEDLRFTLGLSGRFEKRNSPGYSADPNEWMNLPQQIVRVHPYLPESYTDAEGKVWNVGSPTASSPASPMAALEESGYKRYLYDYWRTDASLEYKAPWLKGLSFKFTGAYDITYTQDKSLSNPYIFMRSNTPTENTKELTYSPVVNPGASNISLGKGHARQNFLTTQSSINYANTFGLHDLGLMFLAETRETNYSNTSASGIGLDFIELDELNHLTNTTLQGENKPPVVGGGSSMTRVAGFLGRVNYNYDNKYFLEAFVRRDGSYLFGGMNKRWVTLPGMSLGWRINREDWFHADWVNNLKLRAGIGKTATSGVSPFMWRNTMALSKNAVILGGVSQSMLYYSILANPSLSWEQCMNYNVGVDATLWNGLLGIEADVFYKYEYDKIATTTGAYPPSRGGYYFTSANVNKCDYKGFDLTLSHHNRIGDFNYGAKLIWSYAYGRYLKVVGDSPNAPEYQRLTGKHMGSYYGFIAEGLFESEADIANSPTVEGYEVRPGYIKYKDLNGDGIITENQDQGYVSASAIPLHTGSMNLFGDWKGLDFDLLFSWGLGSSVALTGQYPGSGTQDNTAFTKPFYHLGNSPVYLVEKSWTPENKDAEFPRLEITGSSNNNGFSSTFWYRNGDYLRLKSAQVGYTIPKTWAEAIKAESLRIYVEGFNLLTFSGLMKYNIDPESPAVNNGYYPQQRKVTLGARITF